MKKTFLFAVLAMGLAACANVEDVLVSGEAQSIALQAVTQKQTRGAIDGSYIPASTTIYVGAYQKVTTPTPAYTLYLNNVSFTCANPTATDADSRYWTADYNYPATGSIDFLAYTCDEGADQVTPTATWTANVTDQYVSGLDLEFGANLKGQTDVCYSDVFKAVRNDQGKYEKPSLRFHHSQAWIKVLFSENAALGSSMNIRNVKIKDAEISGDLKLSIDNKGKITPTWTNKATAADELFPAFEVAGEIGMSYTEAVDADTKGILVLPCSEKVISFEYQTKNGVNASGVPTYTDWVEFQTTVSADKLWKAEYKYVYIFSLNSDRIEFTTTLQPFDSDPNDIHYSI